MWSKSSPCGVCDPMEQGDKVTRSARLYIIYSTQGGINHAFFPLTKFSADTIRLKVRVVFSLFLSLS